MSQAGAKNQNSDIQKLLEEIDNTVSVDDVGKDARLSDARNNLSALKADLIGLRRMLIQHPRPDTPVQELNGQTLGAAIRDKIKQSKRLEDYINELEELPDDPPVEDEARKASADEALQDADEPDILDHERAVSRDG
jgi:hypothetical protein